jgi:hypothetical protein
MQRYDLDNSGDLSADEFEKLVSQSNTLHTLRTTVGSVWQVLVCMGQTLHVASAVYEHALCYCQYLPLPLLAYPRNHLPLKTCKSNLVKHVDFLVKLVCLLPAAGE